MLTQITGDGLLADTYEYGRMLKEVAERPIRYVAAADLWRSEVARFQSIFVCVLMLGKVC